ncbi:MAG: CDP-alcohol phosphatidyltransferase family protein [Mesorhizobium sp.]|nr:CDP-alcohol phosphatidyltransferase family protein [Mesorhizobium sp.]
MPTLYDLKPRFQNLLRPLARRLAAAGITANQLTIAAAFLSVATGALLTAFSHMPALFWLLPVVLFVRMALNTLDGMLAREFGQASRLGACLNELADIASDAALILPFAFVAPFGTWGVMAFAFAALTAEFAGVLGHAIGAGRIYVGPFGKSDRALALGILAAVVASGVSLPAWAAWLFPLMAVLSLLTMANRIRAGLRLAS